MPCASEDVHLYPVIKSMEWCRFIDKNIDVIMMLSSRLLLSNVIPPYFAVYDAVKFVRAILVETWDCRNWKDPRLGGFEKDHSPDLPEDTPVFCIQRDPETAGGRVFQCFRAVLRVSCNHASRAVPAFGNNPVRLVTVPMICTWPRPNLRDNSNGQWTRVNNAIWHIWIDQIPPRRCNPQWNQEEKSHICIHAFAKSWGTTSCQ